MPPLRGGGSRHGGGLVRCVVHLPPCPRRLSHRRWRQPPNARAVCARAAPGGCRGASLRTLARLGLNAGPQLRLHPLQVVLRRSHRVCVCVRVSGGRPHPAVAAAEDCREAGGGARRLEPSSSRGAGPARAGLNRRESGGAHGPWSAAPLSQAVAGFAARQAPVAGPLGRDGACGGACADFLRVRPQQQGAHPSRPWNECRPGAENGAASMHCGVAPWTFSKPRSRRGSGKRMT